MFLSAGAVKAQTYEPDPGLNANCPQSDLPDFGFDVFERNHPAISYEIQSRADADLAVGPCYVVPVSNFGIRAYDKTGIAGGLALFLGQNIIVPPGPPAPDPAFWNPLSSTPPPPYLSRGVDPQVIWDAYAGRFWACAIIAEREEFPSTFTPDRWYLALAVSKTDDPNPSGGDPGWHFYRFNATDIGGNAEIDQPKLSVDNDNFYMTMASATFAHYRVIIDAKADYLNGSAPALQQLDPAPTAFHFLTVTDRLVSPAVRFGVDDGTPQYGITDGYGLGVGKDANAVASHVTLHGIRRDGSGVDQHVVTALVPYRQDGEAVQPGTVPLSTDHGQFITSVYRSGTGGGSLWAVHTVRHDDNPPTEQSYIRWYEFHLNDWPASSANPTLYQSGELALLEDYNGYYPSIAVDSLGNAAITFNVSSDDKPVSIWQALRCHNDPLGTFRQPFEIKAGSGTYLQSPTSHQLWGDYTGTPPDPVAGGVFWAHAQYPFGSDPTDVWRSWVSKTELSCGPDADGDGASTPFDLAKFIQLYGAGDPRADYVGDGALTIEDIGAFAVDLAGSP